MVRDCQTLRLVLIKSNNLNEKFIPQPVNNCLSPPIHFWRYWVGMEVGGWVLGPRQHSSTLSDWNFHVRIDCFRKKVYDFCGIAVIVPLKMQPIMVQLTPALCMSRLPFLFFQTRDDVNNRWLNSTLFLQRAQFWPPSLSSHLRLKRVRWGNKKIKKCLDLEKYRCGSGSAAFFLSQTRTVTSAFQNRMNGKKAHWSTHEKYPHKKGTLKCFPCVFMHKVFFLSFSFFFLECTSLQCLYCRVHRAAPTCPSVCLWSPLFSDTLCWMWQLPKEPECSRSCWH